MGGLVVAQGPTCYKFGVNLGLNPDLEFLNPDQGPDPDRFRRYVWEVDSA